MTHKNKSRIAWNLALEASFVKISFVLTMHSHHARTWIWSAFWPIVIDKLHPLFVIRFFYFFPGQLFCHVR